MSDTPMTVVWSWLLRTSWQAGVLVALVAAIHLLLGRWLAPRWRYALWMLVVVRLLMPVTPESPWSIFNVRLPDGSGVAAAPAPPAPPIPPLPGDVKTTVTIVREFPDAPHATRAESPQVAKPASDGGIHWANVLMALWVGGVIVLITRFVIGYLAFARRLRRAPAADDAVLKLLDECRREMGVRSHVRLVPTDAVAGPALFGVWRPKLLVPPRLLAELSVEELRFVFLHELAHVRRRDGWAAALLTAANALHWFNPLARVALERCRAERELACDGLVLSVTGATARHAYGRTMLKLAEAMCATGSRAAAPAGAIGMLHNRSQLRRRIGMVVGFKGANSARRRWKSLAPIALLLLVASCAMTDKPGPDPDAATQRTSTHAATVDELTALARRQINEKKYDDALVTIDRLHVLDPSNEYAVGIRPLVYDKSELKQKRDADEQAARNRNIDREQEVPAPEHGVEQPLSAEDAAARALLDKRLPEAKFDKTGFGDVIDFLRDVTGANIFVNWKTLEATGVKRDAPVTARLRDVKLATALNAIFADVADGKERLGYSVEDGVITITTRRDLRRNTLTRVYDIRDLLITIPNYEPPPATGATGPATRAVEDDAQARERQLQQIIQLVKETVSPEEWTDSGSMRELNGQLIVTATPDTQAQLASLLDQLRETRAIQATIETRFITLDLETLAPALRDKFRQSFGKPGAPKAVFLDEHDTAAILAETQKQRESTILTAPRVTLFNGQRAYVQVANERAYVSGFTVVKNEKGETRYEPYASTVSSGVLLDVQATASADRKFVTVTLKPKLTRLEGLTPIPWDAAPPGVKDLFVQVPILLAQELQTTVTVPDGGTLLLGGFVENASGLPRTRPATQPATKPVKDLYMLVKPTMIIQREQEPKQFPLLSNTRPSK